MATKTWTGGAGDKAWATAGNWSPSGAPASSDDVIFDQNAATGVSGGDFTSGGTITLNSLRIKLTFGSSSILFGDNGTPVKVAVTAAGLVRIGEPANGPSSANGSQRINLDLSTSNCIVTVYGSATTAIDSSKEVVRLRMNHASSTLDVLGGSVGVATDNSGDTATIGTVNVSGGTLNLASGCTLTTVNNNGGTLTVGSAITTLLHVTGTTTTFGTGLIGTLTMYAGNVSLQHRASGNSITTLNLRGGSLSLKADGRAITIATLNYRAGTIKQFSDSQATYTAVALDFNGGTSLTLSAS
jgi:hypothetical protein